MQNNSNIFPYLKNFGLWMIIWIIERGEFLFNYFMYDDRKTYYVTTAEHSKLIIELLQNRTVLFSDMSTMWENAYSCA